MYFCVCSCSLVHWDVNNEQEHGDWFELNTRDADVTAHMFLESQALAPNIGMFLNDYGVLTYSQSAQV